MRSIDKLLSVIIYLVKSAYKSSFDNKFPKRSSREIDCFSQGFEFLAVYCMAENIRGSSVGFEDVFVGFYNDDHSAFSDSFIDCNGQLSNWFFRQSHEDIFHTRVDFSAA